MKQKLLSALLMLCLIISLSGCAEKAKFGDTAIATVDDGDVTAITQPLAITPDTAQNDVYLITNLADTGTTALRGGIAPMSINNGWFEIAVDGSGNLQNVIETDLLAAGQTGNYAYVTKLRISGGMAAADFAFIRNNLSGLVELDLTYISNTDLPASAFYSTNGTLNNLATVNLPTTMATLGVSAFEDCTALTNMDLTYVTLLGSGVFKGCTKLTLESGTNLNQLLTAIPNNAFRDCAALTNVDLTYVTTLGNHAFKGCAALTNVDLSKVTTLGEAAFENCTNLTLKTGTNLNVGLAEIPAHAFQNCAALTNVDLTYVTTLGNSTFKDCTKLTLKPNTNLNATLGTIPTDAFKNCAALTNVDLSNVTNVGNNAFQSCAALTNVDLSKVTTMGTSAFEGCTALTLKNGTNLSANLLEIPNSTFANCAALTNVDLTNVKTLGYSAFENCTKLTLKPNTNLNTTLDTIPNYAFSGCTALMNVDLTYVTTLGNGAFEGCTALTFKAGTNLAAGLTKIPAYAFKNCAALTNVDLSKVTTLENSAFEGCSKLTLKPNTNLSATLDKIPAAVFKNCAALTNVDLTYVKTLGSYAFSGCTKLTLKDGTNLSTSLVIISYSAFQGCQALTNVDLSSVTTLDEYAFNGCTALRAVALPATKPSIGADAFNNVPALALVVSGGGTLSDLSGFPAGSAYPSITGNANVTVGGTLSLAVSPNAASALKYQWYKGSTLLPAETGRTLSINNAQTTDSGAYRCIITLGSVSNTLDFAVTVATAPSAAPNYSPPASAVTPSRPMVPKPSKDGLYVKKQGLQQDGTVSWQTTVNPSQNGLSDVVINAVPGEGQLINVGSLVVYPATVAPNGSISVSGGKPPLVAAQDYRIKYYQNSDGKWQLDINFINDYAQINEAYVITYGVTVITKHQPKTKVTLTSAATILYNGDGTQKASASLDVNVGEGSGWILADVGAIKFLKMSAETQAPLEGAAFELYYIKPDGTRMLIGTQVVSGTSGLVEFYNLPYGDYELQEIKAPDGYIMLSQNPYTFALSAANSGTTLNIENSAEKPIVPPASDQFALVNLLLAVFAFAMGALQLVFLFKRKNKRSGMVWQILAIVLAIASPIVFLLTGSLSGTMIFADKWTAPMVAIAIVQIIALLLKHVQGKKTGPDGKING